MNPRQPLKRREGAKSGRSPLRDERGTDSRRFRAPSQKERFCSWAFLLDTHALIARLAQQPAVLAIVESAEEIFLPGIALGELFYGAYKSQAVEHNLTQLEKLASSTVVLDCDIGTARFYGRIQHLLRSKGRPISQNDVWIAAIALQYGLTLLTRDKHFDRIDDLQVAAW